MKQETQRLVQLFLVIGLLAAGLRLLWIYRERHEPAAQRGGAAQSHVVNPDYYVVPPQAVLTNLASAKRMRGSTVWVRDGFRYPSWPFDPKTRRVQHAKDAPLLGPIQRLVIDDVIEEPATSLGVHIVDFVFEDPAVSPASRALGVGNCDRTGEDCRFFVDDMFYLKDPHQLYSHWKPEVWKAIENHEVHEGMTEAQVFFSIGFGRGSDQISGRVVRFQPPGRPPVTVTFNRDGYAVDVEQ